MSLLVQAANFHSVLWEFCSFQCQSGFLSADCWWLMLIDSDWCWLMLIDSDWCWLMLMVKIQGSQWLSNTLSQVTNTTVQNIWYNPSNIKYTISNILFCCEAIFVAEENNISSIYHLKFCIVRKVALKRLVRSTFFCFSSSDPFFVSHDSESGALSDGLVVTELKYATKSAPMLGVGNTLQSRQRAREMQVDFFAGATFSHLQ